MLKLKKFSLLLVSLFISGNLAYAAVNPIVDTMYSSSFGSLKSSVTDTGSSDDDSSHTSTYEGVNLPECGNTVVDVTAGEAAAKNLCAGALGVDSAKVNFELCGDGTKGNCNYLETCRNLAGTNAVVNGNGSVAISQNIASILARYNNVDNNQGVEAARCSDSGTPVITFKCDSSYTLSAEPECSDGKQALSCSLNGGSTLWKCDYSACTSEQLDKTLGDDTTGTSNYLRGTKVTGNCYEKMADNSRKLRKIYGCDAEIYKFTKASCQNTKGNGYTVASENSACVWNGAYRQGQSTRVDEDQALFEVCAPLCAPTVTASADTCSNSGDILNSCVLPGASVTDNQILHFCGCPLNSDGTEKFTLASDCPSGSVAGGRHCTSKTGDLRYQFCLPQCSTTKTIKGSFRGCVTDLETENSALTYTPLNTSSKAAVPLTSASDSTDYNRYPRGAECCRIKDGTKYDCIGEPYKLNADGTCSSAETFYCADSFRIKNNCGDDTQMCCQFKSSGGVISSSCLGWGTFISDPSNGTCHAGTPLSSTFDYCATADKQKDSVCSSNTVQCCSFKGNNSFSSDSSCSENFILLNDEGACSKVSDNVVETGLCFVNEGDEKASFTCSCPENQDYILGDCPAGQTSVSSCRFDGGVKNICAPACSAEDIAAGNVKSNVEDCRVRIYDEPVSSLCTMPDGSLKHRCACPSTYKTCPGNIGGGTACTFDGGQKYMACALNRSAIICEADRTLFDNQADCKTDKGTPGIATQCYVGDEAGEVKFMCDCPANYKVCPTGEEGAGDKCSVAELGVTYYETCAKPCRSNTSKQPVVSSPDECAKLGEDEADTEMCINKGEVKYECTCPAGYVVNTDENMVGIGASCSYDGPIKYKSYEAGCPLDRPVYATEDACSFDGVKGVNVQTCYINGKESDDNRRYYCDCPSSYKTDAECKAVGANKEGSGYMCQLEGQTYEKTKYQSCYNKCSELPSSATNNGKILEDDINDNRACAWELGQGAKYEQCSDNHIIKNKCYCGSEYDGRLDCLGEDNLAPDIGPDKPACIIDGTTYYQACKASQCDEGAVLATSAAGCSTLLGTASTAIECSKAGESTSYYQCACDTSQYKEICKYPQVEPTGSPFCYASKYDASSNPSPDKQYKSGACKVGAIEKCYQDGDATGGYMVTVTRSESECRNTLGDGAEARLCEDRNDPDIRRYNCYYNIGDYKWTSSNCPVRHLLTGGSIVVNGIRYYKECNCHPAYQAHRYNCAGILSGGACEQDVTPDNNDGTIPASITKLKFYPYCSCSEDYNQVCDGERMIGVGDPCNGKYKSCECKKDELPANWADNYYGCPGGAKPTGVIKPNGCGGKYYQCEVSQCTWEHTEQCKGDFQIGVDPCQDNQGNIYAYKSCTCPVGWKKCSSSQVGVGKPCSLGGENYYESCTNQDECTKGEYLTCNSSLQIGINPCTKNDKTYFESCACASGYNKKCTDGEIGVGSACVLDGVSYYTECSKPATTCTDAHKDACATNQEKYDPCVTSDNKVKYKCRCPANFTTCAGTTPLEGATVCYDAEKGTVYSGCTGSATCSTDEESVYKTCTKQQIGIGQSCVSTDGTTKYAECQDTNDCKANGYQYTCSSYETDALGTDFCVDDKGTKFYKECKCPANYLQCPSKNVKGTPCTPLNSDGTYGDTIYSKCECGAQYSETCTGNGQSPGSAEDACDSIDEDGEVVTRYKSCVCGDEFNKNCAETGAIPTESSAICTEIKYIGTQIVKTDKYSACGCGEQFKYKCDGTDAGDDAANAGKYTLSGACTTTSDGEPVVKYRSCACGSIYNTVCTSNIQPGADSCTSINADGSRTTKYVAGSCPEPEPEPCVPSDCSSYPMTGSAAIVAQCAHPKNYNSCSPGCGQDRKYACLYPKSDLEDKWKYTRENCPEPNELSEGKTFNFAEGVTEIRYQKCKCPTDYDKTDTICKGISASTVAGKDGDIVCSLRSKPVAPSTSTISGICVSSSYTKVDGCGTDTAFCCQEERAPAFNNECMAKSDPDVVTHASGSCEWLKTTTTEVTFTPDSCGPILSLDSSEICTDVETKEKFGKYCKCDGPSYVQSSCPSTTATVCKKSTSTEWQYVKCGS